MAERKEGLSTENMTPMPRYKSSTTHVSANAHQPKQGISMWSTQRTTYPSFDDGMIVLEHSSPGIGRRLLLLSVNAVTRAGRQQEDQVWTGLHFAAYSD